MGTIEMKAVFDWTGDHIYFVAGSKSYFENILMEAYGIWCKAVNPQIESWNAESDSLGIKPSEDYDSEYMRFMWKKHAHVLENLANKEKLPKPAFPISMVLSYDWSLGEELEIHLHLRGHLGTKMTEICEVSFHLEEL